MARRKSHFQEKNQCGLSKYSSAPKGGRKGSAQDIKNGQMPGAIRDNENYCFKLIILIQNMLKNNKLTLSVDADTSKSAKLPSAAFAASDKNGHDHSCCNSRQACWLTHL